MAERTIKQKIQDFLENLSAKDFKKFVQALVDRRAEPRIATSRVEGKDFLDVTNVIVTTYGEAQALEVVCEVLRVCAIDATDLGNKMVAVKGLQDVASAMENQQRPHRFCLQGSSDQILFDVRSSFIEGMSGPVLKSLLDKLFEKKVLTDSERESADEMQYREDKARFVIDTVRRKGEAASSEMIQVLQEGRPLPL